MQLSEFKNLVYFKSYIAICKKLSQNTKNAIYERNFHVFAVCLSYFCMKKYVLQPLKLPYPSKYATYLPILTRDKRYNTACFRAL